MPKGGKPGGKPGRQDDVVAAAWAGVLELNRIADAVEVIRDQGKVRERGAIINVTRVDVDAKKEKTMTDHMPPLQLPVTTVRAQLSIVDPRKADGSRAESYSWETSDPTQLPLEAIPDSTVKDANGNEVLDPADNLPLKVFSTFANTPLTGDEVDQLPNKIASGTVTAKSAGMADVDILVQYSDPPLGHAVITAVQVPEA